MKMTNIAVESLKCLYPPFLRSIMESGLLSEEEFNGA